MKKSAILLLLVGICGSYSASASSHYERHHERRSHHGDSDHHRQCTTTEQSTWLPLATVMMKAESDGYRLRKAKVKRSCYEVEVEKSGARIKKYYDPSNGNLIHSFEK